ncbi:MAG: hypothetical protein QOD94_224 [Alphaproteobacteria bacterium]|jgi:hypothetical protein|nr:hypothetical protein [Alphaproteobacteria bacterium]
MATMPLPRIPDDGEGLLPNVVARHDVVRRVVVAGIELRVGNEALDLHNRGIFGGTGRAIANKDFQLDGRL